MIVEVEVFHNRHVIDHQVVDDMRVGVVAGEHYLFGDQPATYLITSLNKYYLQSGFGQVGCGHEAVGAAADDDDIPGAFVRELVEYTADKQWLFVFFHLHYVLLFLLHLFYFSTLPWRSTADILPRSGMYHGDGYHQSPGSAIPSSISMCIRL